MSINLGHIVATVDGDHLTGEPVAARAAAALILTPAQAEAVYSAMCALNNVFAKVDVTFGTPDDGVHVYESKWGRQFVWVCRMSHGVVRETEKHEDQHAFSTAYGLNEDEPQPQPHDEAECWPDNHGPLSNLPHDA